MDAHTGPPELPKLFDHLTIPPTESLPPSPFEGMCCNNAGGIGGMSPPCPNKATFQCQNCQLVQYCGKYCERAHKDVHQKDCQSPYLEASWKPSGETPKAPCMDGNYIWGNVPAYDLLKLPSNEGSNYDKDLNICFAASGDLRNFFTTIGALPLSYNHHVECTINDANPSIVERNILLILICYFFSDDEVFVAEAIIHLWYSTKIPQRLIDHIKDKIMPKINEAWNSVGDEADDKKTCVYVFHSGTRRLTILLPRPQWLSLMSIWKPELHREPTKSEAETSWRKCLNGWHLNGRKDPPGIRAAEMKFRETGVLQPFGASTENFTTLNPTLFRRTYLWLPILKSTPLGGWLKRDLEKSQTEHCLPKNDIFGGMFFHVRELLVRFLRRISKLDIALTMTCESARLALGMSRVIRRGRTSFDRIDTSNIADKIWFGIHNTLLLGSHLNHENPHASLMTYFMPIGSVVDNGTFRSIMHSIKLQKKGKIQQEVPILDLYFQFYELICDFEGAAKAAGLAKKSETNATEFYRCGDFVPMSRFNSGYWTRFVEWKPYGGMEGKESVKSEDKIWDLKHDWATNPKGVEEKLWEALAAWYSRKTEEE